MLIIIYIRLIFASQDYEIEIVSNRDLEWHDEVCFKFAHTAHHARRAFFI